MISLLLVVFCLLLSAFYTGSETAAYRINRIRLRFRCRPGSRSPGARTLSAALADPQMLVATTLVGTNISHYIATAACAAALMSVPVRHAALWSALIMAPVLLTLGEIVPKAFFARHANRLMYRLAFIIRATTLALWPVVILLKGLMIAFDRLFGKAEPQGLGAISVLRLKHFIEESRQEGVLSSQQDSMARNIMELERIKLRKVMIPLEKVAAIPGGASAPEIRQLAREHALSRFPVYQGDRRNIIGVLGLVDCLCREAETLPADLIRPAVKLPESMPIDEALLRLRRAKEHMGIVTDAHGWAVGIVTIKDLVEEIVGDLQVW